MGLNFCFACAQNCPRHNHHRHLAIERLNGKERKTYLLARRYDLDDRLWQKRVVVEVAGADDHTIHDFVTPVLEFHAITLCVRIVCCGVNV